MGKEGGKGRGVLCVKTVNIEVYGTSKYSRYQSREG